MSTEALRPRTKGQANFVDELIEFAVGIANEALVPHGIAKEVWDSLKSAERFYLKLLELEALSKERDQIVNDARDVRRTYIGLKMKLEVLSKESDATKSNKTEIDNVKTRLIELKARFADLKQKRIKIAETIEEGDRKIDIIDDKLRETRQKRRGQASVTFQVIGEGNKEISILRAETALIETKMRQLHAEIGRYVSRNANQDPTCAAASAHQHGLVDVMRALRRSISLNHRLAGTA